METEQQRQMDVPGRIRFPKLKHVRDGQVAEPLSSWR